MMDKGRGVAVKWTGFNILAVYEVLNIEEDSDITIGLKGRDLLINTLEGQKKASISNYIVRDLQGNISVYTKEDFYKLDNFKDSL